MATYGLVVTSMYDAKTDLDQVTASLKSALDSLNGYVNTYTANNAGDAATAYTAAQTKWNTGFSEMQDALTKGSGALDTITDNYQQTDLHSSQLFS